MNINNLKHYKNIFPNKIAEEIHEKFVKETKWERIEQVREKHYSHVFKNDSSFLPDEDEKYLSSFFRSDKLSQDDLISKCINNHIIKKIEKDYNKKISNIDIRCHYFGVGDFFRIHFDNYAGSLAVTINLSKNWKWDWGGFLCVPYGDNYENLSCLFPEWNSMNILDNTLDFSPHFVTPIQNFAKGKRYTITIFIS